MNHGKQPAADTRCAYWMTQFVRCRRRAEVDGYCAYHVDIAGKAQDHPGFPQRFEDSRFNKGRRRQN